MTAARFGTSCDIIIDLAHYLELLSNTTKSATTTELYVENRGKLPEEYIKKRKRPVLLFYNSTYNTTENVRGKLHIMAALFGSFEFNVRARCFPTLRYYGVI